MAWFLVNATVQPDRMPELEDRLRQGAFQAIQPEGHAIHQSLSQARLGSDGRAWWEQQSFSVPPLANERLLVLDRYFVAIGTDAIQQGEGWHQLDEMPLLFPRLYQE